MKLFSSPIRFVALFVSVVLVCSTVSVPRLRAQSAEVGPVAPRRIARPALEQMLAVSPMARLLGQAPTFRIVVVRGDGAINNISQRTAGEPIVAIRDENDNPVAGVAVTFLLPDNGPSGLFPNGENSVTVVTDANGEAAGNGLAPNTTEGEFAIQVTAVVQQQVLAATITQTNTLTGALAVAGAGGISTKVILILAAIGGAVAGTAVAVSGSDSTTSVNPVVLQPGDSRVVAPPQ